NPCSLSPPYGPCILSLAITRLPCRQALVNPGPATLGTHTHYRPTQQCDTPAPVRLISGSGMVTSKVEDDARLPVLRNLLDGDLMVGHRFDLSVNGVTLGVQGLTSDRGRQVRWLQRRKSEGAAEQALRIVQVEQLAEPPHEQILHVGGADAECDGLLRADGRSVAHQVEHGPGGVGEEFGEILPIHHHPQVAGVRERFVDVRMWCLTGHRLAFDDAKRAQLRDLLADTSPVHDIDDLADVLVCFRNFLHERRPAGRPYVNPLILELTHDGPATGYLFGLRAAQHTPGAVTTTGKSFGAALLGANEHIGIAAHITRDQHWLPEVPVDCWDLGMVGWQRARGALTVHAQASRLAVNHVRLELANVVADVVNDLDTHVPGRTLQDFFKSLTHPVGDQLPIGKGKIRRAVHSTDVLVCLRRG